jgi:prepilin-type N-terminal cleavage/methylation domain-containing protein
MRKKFQGFTIMELLIVVILIGIIAGFAIPNYEKAVRKAHERDMQIQLMALHAANVIYRAHTGTYWDTGGANQTDLATINSALGLNIIANDGTSYSYNGATGSFTAYAVWSGYTIRVINSPINTSVTPPNPCCVGGGCFSVGSC